ncbi:MAG: glycyl-radical enzyme activating protein [Candidatus Schekmanbacteria bacterium]|nr:glycyl-radical enzyme activating protein [Candidatus Schekmanbacteria bacterium]
MQQQGLIFDVQRFSVHDGPGIRTTVFLKGCPLRCRWCQNPESLRPRQEIAFFAERCRGHGDCFAACPHAALRRSPAARLDRERCTGCGDCAGACAAAALRRVGRSVTVAELLAEVSRDRSFYASSGGGVTLSGGEPTLQMPFIRAFAAAATGAGLTVGLQTCGAFSWSAFAPLLADLALIHYDLKAIDGRLHRELTGADNRAILSNARELAERGAPVLFRMPVIPGANDTADNLEAVARFVLGLGARRLHLLRYHALGESKLAALGQPRPPMPDDGLASRHAEASLSGAVRRLRELGLEVST